MSGRRSIPLRVDGVRYESVAEAARAIGCRPSPLEYAVRHSGRYKGHRVTYADPVAAKDRARLRRNRCIDEWYKRHRYEHDRPRMRQEIRPGERLLRPRTLGPGEARG